MALREVLYSSSGSAWNPREVVIEAAAPGADPVDESGAGNKCSPGFILHEVETVLLEIRSDLDSPVPESTSDAPLMSRIRDHTNVIAVTLTGRPLNHDDKSTTIAQLIADLNGLRASVENDAGAWCSIL